MNNAFARALLTAALEDYATVSPEENIVFSPAFEKKMEKLCKNTDRRVFHPVQTAFRRAILIAALLAALAVTAFAVPSIRNAILDFFVHDAGTHYEFTFTPEQAAAAPKQIEKVYRPMYIPEGFSLAEPPIISNGAVMHTWYSASLSKTGDFISFDQHVIPQGENNSGPSAEGVRTETLELNGYTVFCIYDYGVLYHWTNEEYFFQLYCDPGISEENRNKIFCSIAIDESIPPPNNAP